MQHCWMTQWSVHYPQPEEDIVVAAWQMQELIDEENDSEVDITVGDE